MGAAIFCPSKTNPERKLITPDLKPTDVLSFLAEPDSSPNYRPVQCKEWSNRLSQHDLTWENVCPNPARGWHPCGCQRPEVGQSHKVNQCSSEGVVSEPALTYWSVWGSRLKDEELIWQEWRELEATPSQQPKMGTGQNKHTQSKNRGVTTKQFYNPNIDLPVYMTKRSWAICFVPWVALDLWICLGKMNIPLANPDQ